MTDSDKYLDDFMDECYDNLMAHLRATASRRTCCICDADRPEYDFIGRGRKCVECRNAKVAKCSRCKEIKSVDEFYKGNSSGKCRACKLEVKAAEKKVRGFKALSDVQQRELIADTQRCYQFKRDRSGDKVTFTQIAVRYGISPATYSLWRRREPELAPAALTVCNCSTPTPEVLFFY